MKIIAAGGVSVKTLGRAIQCLARIGNELFIESMDTGIAFRTVNSARSAYACFLFPPTFFEHYSSGSGDEATKCKISIKSCLPIFKSLSFLEKCVEKCKIILDLVSDRLIFQLNCKYGIVKTYHLAFNECETLQAVFSRDDYLNKIVGVSRVFSEAVQNFQVSQEEISLTVSADRLILQNYTDDEPDPTNLIYTEMILEPDEFEVYEIEQDTQVTFCLKELRAILFFTDRNTYPISVHFDQSGKPIVFSVTEDSESFQADFVFATLSDNADKTQNGNSQEVENKKTKTPVNSKSVKRKNQHSPPDSNVFSINTVSSLQQNYSKQIGDISCASTSKDSGRVRLGTLIEENSNDSSISRNILESDVSGEVIDKSISSIPPNKKVRSLFMSLFESPEHEPDSSEVLASDSDES